MLIPSQIHQQCSPAQGVSVRHYRYLLLRVALLLGIAFFLAGCVRFDPEGGWAAPVAADEYVYVASRTGKLLRVHADSGTLDPGFQYSPTGEDSGFTVYGTPRLVDRIVYGAGYGGKGGQTSAYVFAVDAQTGSPVWAGGTFQLNTEIVGAVAVHGDTLVFGTGAIGREGETPGFLYALDTTADADRPLSESVNRFKWRFPVGGAVWGTPVIADGIAYFGSMDGVFHAVDLEDKPAYETNPEAREVWRFSTDATFVSQPLITEDRVYVGDFKGIMYALDSKARERDATGRTIDVTSEWQFDSGGWFWSAPVLEKDVLYVGTLSGRVYALESDTGRELWSEPGEVDGKIVAPITLFDYGKTRAIAVPSAKEDVWIIRTVDGTSQGKFETDASVKAAPAIANNLVFVHTLDDRFLTFSSQDRSRKACVNIQNMEPCK